jgi:hypothetical protein
MNPQAKPASAAGTVAKGDKAANEVSVRKLRIGNTVVGLIFLVQVIAILLLSNDFSIPVVATYQNGPPGTPGTGETFTMFSVRFGWAIAFFLVLAAADHLLMATPKINGWYERQLDQGRNTARGVEYSISSSVMIVLICLLTGINDIYALVAIFGVNAAMILFGLLMERINPDRSSVDWWPFIFGCIAGIVPWIAITLAIVGAQQKYSGVPGFVFAIFISLFILFNCFAINQLLQYRNRGRFMNYRFGEYAFIILSLIAKSLLAWQVFSGALFS